MDASRLVTKRTFAGLFLITLASLMYETLLTRIFSVTMWHHFAFMAVSLALFGMTVGAVLVYLFPAYFSEEQVKHRLAVSSLLFALTIIISFLTHLSVPFTNDVSLVGAYAIALTYVVLALPFIFCGISVCLALTKFSRGVSKLYAADLIGAAVGCILLIFILDLTDGPTAVIVSALIASLGALLFATETASRKLVQNAGLLCVVIALLAGANAYLFTRQAAPIRLVWVKGELEPPLLYEKWNSFSRIRVYGNPDKPVDPIGWGLSPTCLADRKIRQLGMDIDASAATVLTAFDGNLEELDYLKCDVTNVAHYLRPNARVAIIGAGGGRDILAALVFRQKSILGIEINDNIVNTVNARFGDFTGHLDRYPQVTWVKDEARSYLTRSNEKFDIIQVSLVDTWAATASGTFVLAEHSLYTVEAWKIFLSRLNPGGILAVSRWYSDQPYEMYRLTSLASTSLAQLGIQNPRQHIVIVRYMPPDGSDPRVGIGTMLVSSLPFSDSEIATLEDTAARLQFEIVLSPRFAMDSNLAAIASAPPSAALSAQMPLDITAPTDDTPFFFYMLRLRDLLNPLSWGHTAESVEIKAVFVLNSLLILVIVLTAYSIIIPLRMKTDRASLRGSAPLFVFFCSIGLGFMLIEISQMQRLIIFLGHPTYGLSIVLFTLLLSSGLGSYSTEQVSDAGLMRSATVRLAALLAALFIFGMLTPFAIQAFQGSVTLLRIGVAISILFPLGLFMGMAFPLGIKVASIHSAAITPWLWGVNGATSVCASVLAIVIALNAGISAAFWTGGVCYAVAFAALIRSNKKLS